MVPDLEEVPKLIEIFEIYNDCRSTGKLRETLQTKGIKTRSGKNWMVGALNNLLRRTTYVRKIKHKDKEYDGIQEPILDKKLFNEVQLIMDENRLHNGIKTYAKESSLLAGKIF